MKKIFAIFALAVISLSGCDMLQQIVSDGIALVNEKDSELEFDWEGDRAKVMVAAKEDWTAESDSKWCIVTPAKGTCEDTEVKILVDKNRTSEDRTAVVSLNAGSTTLEISVVQFGKPDSDEEDEEGEENDGNSGSQTNETFLFMVTHEAQNFRMPVIEGDFKGLIFWGDGKEEAYSSSVTSHSYLKADERVVIMQLTGELQDFEVKFSSLKDIVKIDLSAL